MAKTPKYQPVHTTAAGTTVVSTTAISVVGVNVNTASAGSLTIKDAAGVIYAVIDTGSLSCHGYGWTINGCTLVQVGAADITTSVSV